MGLLIHIETYHPYCRLALARARLSLYLEINNYRRISVALLVSKYGRSVGRQLVVCGMMTPRGNKCRYGIHEPVNFTARFFRKIFDHV